MRKYKTALFTFLIPSYWGFFYADIILRARLIEGRSDDTTVKLKCIKPKDIGKEWMTANNSKKEAFKVEADIVGSQPICAASLTVDQKRSDIEAVIGGKNSPRKLFSEKQECFLTDCAKILVDLDLLETFGPISALHWKPKLPDLNYEIAIEEWYIPNAFDVFEVSTKVKPKEAEVATRTLVDWLSSKSFELTDAQETKTHPALVHLSKR